MKHALKAKASLAYAMRAQQLKSGMTMFDDASSEPTAFGELGGSRPGGVDAMRRKSALPSQPAAIAT